MTELLITIYWLTLILLSVYGFLGLLTLAFYWRHRHVTHPLPVVETADLPPVTIQLPIFNERYVIDRLLHAATSLDYPRDRLQIQVIDDSTDDTTQRAAELVDQYRAQGFDIELRHRTNRQGYKAGALADAMLYATGEFLALFDADFCPDPSFLQRTVPHFLRDGQLGMVQTRWGHYNHDQSWLTAAQAIALDKHFAMEQTVRHRGHLFPKFNGAGGVWRRRCLEDAGGWQDDTVCEDLCLSTRAILRGWQFRFLNDVVTPAELPSTITAYKSQQARWSKGSLQCLFKYGRAILTAKEQSWVARLYAVLAMSGYLAQFLALILLLLQIPLILNGYTFSRYMLIFSVAAVAQPLLFVMSQYVLYPNWRRRLHYLPALLIVALGTGPNNTRSILQIFWQRHHVFVRTPKGMGVNGRFAQVNGRFAQANAHLNTAGVNGPSINGHSANGHYANGQTPQQAHRFHYRYTFDWIIAVEILLALYAAVGIGLALWQQTYGPIFFLASCLIGFGYVAYLGLREVTA